MSIYGTVVGKLWPPLLAISRVGTKSKLNASPAVRQRTDLLEVNISANKISLPQGQSFTDTEISFNVF